MAVDTPASIYTSPPMAARSHIFPKHIDQQLIASGIPKVTISLQTPDPVTFIIRGAPPQTCNPSSYFARHHVSYVQANLADREFSNSRSPIKFLDTTPHPFLVPHKPLKCMWWKAKPTDASKNLHAWADSLYSMGTPNAPESTIGWPAPTYRPP